MFKIENYKVERNIDTIVEGVKRARTIVLGKYPELFNAVAKVYFPCGTKATFVRGYIIAENKHGIQLKNSHCTTDEWVRIVLSANPNADIQVFEPKYRHGVFKDENYLMLHILMNLHIDGIKIDIDKKGENISLTKKSKWSEEKIWLLKDNQYNPNLKDIIDNL